MKKVTFLLVLTIALATAVPALADGKFYGPEPVPPKIPHQRALLLFEGGRETLFLQSRYRTTGSLSDEFGWVVPLPSVPERASFSDRTSVCRSCAGSLAHSSPNRCRRT